MKTSTKFVNELNTEQREELRQAMKTGNEQVRRRAHGVLLSARGYSVDQIADIYEVDRDTVSNWLDRWEDGGTEGLQDQEGRGRKPTLNEKEQKQAIKIVEKDPRSSKRSLSKIEQKIGKKISRDTLKRILKKGNKTWKRLRRSLRGKRDEADFQAAKAELEGFRAMARAGEIDLYYYDEAGFTLDPCVPYAWQTVGETIEIPAASSDRINVLAFLSADLRFHPFIFEETIDSEIVIACFDYLSQIVTKLTLVVIDGAPTHKSDAFKARLEEWEARGLYVYLLPGYSPELNLIEILWRMIKYDWLPLDAYESFKDLLRSLIAVLKGVGSKYQVNFAH
ncbi:MAG: IS630 family transposase [Blastocatellia bacterium]